MAATAAALAVLAALSLPAGQSTPPATAAADPLLNETLFLLAHNAGSGYLGSEPDAAGKMKTQGSRYKTHDLP